jgi:hypothetical protein
LPLGEKYATFAEKNFNLPRKDTAHMSMSHYFLGKLEDERSELAELTRDKINEMIDAVALNHDTTRDVNELCHLVSGSLIKFDTIQLPNDHEYSIYGIVITGDRNKALLEFVPPPMSSLFFCYHPYQDGEKYMAMSLDNLMSIIEKRIAMYDEDIKETREKIAMYDEDERRSKQRERITELMHHLAEARTLSMMGKLEIQNWVMGAIANLNHCLKEELAKYNKRAHKE